MCWEMKCVILFANRVHYERKLKQRTLEIWQDIWWSGRKGWKLNVRADYHNRLVKQYSGYTRMAQVTVGLGSVAFVVFNVRRTNLILGFLWYQGVIISKFFCCSFLYLFSPSWILSCVHMHLLSYLPHNNQQHHNWQTIDWADNLIYFSSRLTRIRFLTIDRWKPTNHLYESLQPLTSWFNNHQRNKINHLLTIHKHMTLMMTST